MEDKIKSIGKNSVKIAINLGLMFIVLIVLGWLALRWIDVWTRHGEYLVVPELKGLTYNEAVEKLNSEGLSIELLDSAYINARPGEVVEQNPKANNKVKPGRTVYVTIQAFAPMEVTFPDVTGGSLGQALISLKSVKLDADNVIVTREPSEFPDLVLGAKYNGKPISQGARIPVTARIELIVGEAIPQDLDDEVEADDGDAVSEEEILNLN